MSEIIIRMEDERSEDYRDQIITGLVNCGYMVYLDIDGNIVFSVNEYDIIKIEKR